MEFDSSRDTSRSIKLFAMLNQAYVQALAHDPLQAVFKKLLQGLLLLTESDSGFIGAALSPTPGDPPGEIRVIAEIYRNQGGQSRVSPFKYEEELRNPRSLIRGVVSRGEVVIVNNPVAPLEAEEPPIRSFLGTPYYYHGQVVGVMGIANRPAGYDQEMMELLVPFLKTCGTLTAYFHCGEALGPLVTSAPEDEEPRSKGLEGAERDITIFQKPEDHLFVAHRQQLVIDALLRLGFEEISLQEQLDRALEEVASIPWLPFTPKGAIFLVDDEEPGVLRLQAQKELEPELRCHCASVPVGECLCGRCAERQHPLFVSRVSAEHNRTCPGMADHGHYVLPILSGARLLGVLNLYTLAGHRHDREEEKFLATVCHTLAGLIEKKKTEERLRKSEANLLRSQQIAHLGYWEWDIAENRIIWSEEVYRIFGLEPAEQRSVTYDLFLGLVHPEDRFAVQEAVEAALHDNKPYHIEHRLQLFDGSCKIVREEGEITFNEKREPVRMLGIVQDITESKRSEAQLHLAARIFENSIEGITITDAVGVIQKVNPAFTGITGYTAAEAAGKTPRLLKSDRQDQEFYRRMWEAIRKEGGWQGEIWNRRKNGEIYPEWLTITSIKNPLGQAANYVAIFHDMTEIRQAEEQLRYKTNYDALTGLPNRIMLQERLKVALSHGRREGRTVVVFAMDVDNFKHVNESFGHAIGDLLLQSIAARCQDRIPEGSTIARLGGDDFAIILEDLENEYLAVELAEDLIGDLLRPFRLGSHELFVTVSIGITFSPADGDSPERLIGNAEMALYQAKEQGKNTCRMFTKAMNARVARRLQLENSMRRALVQKEFLVYYQPKVEMGECRILGMEALVRWERPGVGLVSPAEFIPLAEENGLIVPIGEWVLATACRQTKQWRDAGHELSVAVNLSPKQFAQKNLVEKIEELLLEIGLPPEALQLEITEGVVLDNEEAAIEQLGRLRAMGVKIALDDFGTGYSSLYYLRQLPIDTLKIDRSFTRDLPGDKDSAAITEAILSMARSLNLEVVAEGVETEEHLGFLCQRDCKFAQGFLFAPPLPAPAFRELLKEQAFQSATATHK